MDPATINFDGLNEFFAQFGPHGYVVGHAVAAMIFGAFAFRQIALAGKCKGEACHHVSNNQTKEEAAQGIMGDSHIWRAGTTGVIAVANLAVVIAMSANLFDTALERANLQPTVSTASHPSTMENLFSEMMDSLRQRENMDATYTPHHRPYFTMAGDGKEFSINTLDALKTKEFQNLKLLVVETSWRGNDPLDSAEGLTRFLQKCEKQGIQVTTIVREDKTVIYDNSGDAPVKVTTIPAITWGARDRSGVTPIDAG